MNSPLLSASWLSRSATEVAPELIGCTLLRRFSNDFRIGGVIVETEAYEPDNPAMHTYQRQTSPNQVMFKAADHDYGYRIYGYYNCLNVVTDHEGIASSVLIRALELETLPPWIDSWQEPKLHRFAGKP